MSLSRRVDKNNVQLRDHEISFNRIMYSFLKIRSGLSRFEIPHGNWVVDCGDDGCICLCFSSRQRDVVVATVVPCQVLVAAITLHIDRLLSLYACAMSLWITRRKFSLCKFYPPQCFLIRFYTVFIAPEFYE